jgi:hypothetical protein
MFGKKSKILIFKPTFALPKKNQKKMQRTLDTYLKKLYLCNTIRENTKACNPKRIEPFREMAEWFKAAVLKTVVLKSTGGSNPSLSAKVPPLTSGGTFFVLVSVLVSVEKLFKGYFMSEKPNVPYKLARFIFSPRFSCPNACFV